jgi:hypothetical protein
MRIELNWIEFQFNKLNQSSTELNPNSIVKKWDANWWKMYWKSTCEYNVEKK